MPIEHIKILVNRLGRVIQGMKREENRMRIIKIEERRKSRKKESYIRKRHKNMVNPDSYNEEMSERIKVKCKVESSIKSLAIVKKNWKILRDSEKKSDKDRRGNVGQYKISPIKESAKRRNIEVKISC